MSKEDINPISSSGSQEKLPNIAGASDSPAASKYPKTEYASWYQFLGPTATPEDVAYFVQNMMKMIEISFQQEAQQTKQASDYMKQVIEGNE
jgi:hypothetical protein